MIGFDYSDAKDLAVLTVAKTDGKRLIVLNTFTGNEAVEMHNKLSGGCIMITKKEKSPC
jgi:hypothetical protein